MKAQTIIADRYQLIEQLGQNAGRQTWLALDLRSTPLEKVVLKLLAFNPQMQWDELKLFEREAQVLKNLNHPQIPRYRDFFSVDEEAGEGLPWFCLVQDYIEGISLKRLLETDRCFTEKEVKNFAQQILSILLYLHELNPPVLHRDIKPSNLVLGENQEIYLVDFGAVQDRAKAQGVTFTVVGTHGYTPPEQLWGKAVPASDLYALGATLIHLLTGVSPADLPQNQLRIDFQKSLKTKIQPSLEKWLELLTHPNVEQRLKTASEARTFLKNGVANLSETAYFNAAPTVNYKRFVALALVQVVTVVTAVSLVIHVTNQAQQTQQQDDVMRQREDLNSGVI